MRRAFPLSVQLLLSFVGLLIGMAIVLTTAATTSVVANLQADATRRVSLATQTREQTLSQLFQLRQQRAEGFLVSLQSFCSERQAGRLAWAEDCVRPMVDDFRKSEGALGASLTYRNRRVRRSGQRISSEAPAEGALAKVVRGANGNVEYVMKAKRGAAVLTTQFDHEQVEKLFGDHSAFGRSAEVFLIDSDGQFLTASNQAPSSTPAQAAALLAHCKSGDFGGFVGPDLSGARSFQSFRPVAALGSACVGATLRYDEALAPAEQLRKDLGQRVVWFALVGIVLSLLAAHWISAPVRRLALSARKLQTGHFDRPLRLGGPSEVRELGRAFNAMSNDLAELVAQEQTARRYAEDANRAKDDFLATVSHELRTPLTSVLGWAQMLRARGGSPERLNHGLSVIERSARAQSRLIEDLLDVSRITANRLRMAREPVPLAPLIEAALDQVRPQAEEKKVEIHTELADAGLVRGDPRRLDQIVCNLVGNAIKFTEPPGSVTVRLQRVDRNMVLTVSDTGVGIPSTFLPYVFEWFRQADPRSSSQSGLGLGLGIVRHLVQLHGGSVRAESPGTGHGATFIVTLPVFEPATRVPDVVQRKPLATLAIAHKLDSARVLVVEDDDDARELVRMTLEDAGAYVETVASAGDARREMMSGPPDVLISDIQMAEEDGYSLVRSLRAAGIVTPAIALTAYARHEDADEAHAAGFQIHLAKPVDAGRLVEAVATLLEHSVH